MPTYQYACTACDERLEAVQSFTDPALTECPVCGGALRKVFSAVGVVFKGSGFYKTDSRASGGSKEKVDASASSSSDGAAKTGDGAKAGSPAKESSGGSSSTNGTSGSGGSSAPASKPAVSAPASKSA